MDYIEELRARAMASMPHKKNKQQHQHQHQQLQSQVSSDPLPGRSHSANNLLEKNGLQKPVISSAPSAPSFNAGRLHDLHPRDRSPVPGKKDDNLVIRFSDGESDSDADDNCLKMDGRKKDGSYQGNKIGSSANQSPAASSQVTAPSASQQTPAVLNQMAMMQKTLAEMRTTMSNAIQSHGVASGGAAEGQSWQSSSNRKPGIGKKDPVGQKHAASVPKPSGIDLENLRKQIATKENELKLQKHIKQGRGQGVVSVPNGKLRGPGIAVSTVGSTGRKFYASPPASKLAGGSDKEMREEKQKVLKVTEQLPDTCLKVNTNNLQQQRGMTLNIDTDDSRAMDDSSDKGPTSNFHPAGSKRPYAEDSPSRQKYLKAAGDIDEKTITAEPVSMSIPASTSSKGVISEHLHHTNSTYVPEREGNKKRKIDGSYTGSRNDVNLIQGQFSTGYKPDHQKQCSVEAFQNKANTENAQEGDRVQVEFEKTEKQILNQSFKTAVIEDCSQKINLGVEQSMVNRLNNDKEFMDTSSVCPFTGEDGFDPTYGRQSAEPACENKSTWETFGNVPQGAQETVGPIILTSREVVEWQARKCPLINTRLTGIHIQDDLLQLGSISLQDLMKEEELVDKELEKAQEYRNRCENKERIAWTAYRNAQNDVQAASQRCLDLHKKRERLSGQVRALAMRDYSSKGYPDRDQQRKESFSKRQSFLGHKKPSIATYSSPVNDQLEEASEHPVSKLNEHGSIVDCGIISSLQTCNGNDWSSKYGIQSCQQNSDDRLSKADVVHNTSKEFCMADKNIEQGKIYGSISSEIVAGKVRDIVSCEPEAIFGRSEQQKELEGKLVESRESTLKMTEAFERHQVYSNCLQRLSSCQSSFGQGSFELSENMEICKSSGHGLRREDTILGTIRETTVENDEKCEMIPKVSITPEISSDEKKLAESSYDVTEVLCDKHKFGIHEENSALVGNAVSNLGGTHGDPTDGNSQIEHEGRAQQVISSVNLLLNSDYCDMTKSATFTESDMPVGSVSKGCDGREGHHFVSISNENTENLAVNKTGGSNFEQTNSENKCLPQKRKWVNQVPASECGSDGLAKFTLTLAKKSNLSTESLALTNKIKEEGIESPAAETSTESLHGQNYDHEYNIQFPAEKHDEFAYPCLQSLERLLEVPGEVVKTPTVGHLMKDDMQENSAGTCHSENSLAGGIECERTNIKRFAPALSSVKSNNDNFEEFNEERFHSGSSVDEGCAGEKENIAVWKNTIEEQATFGNSGKSVAYGVANMENQGSMQQIVKACALVHGAAQCNLRENFAQTKLQAVNTNYCEEASSVPSESDFWMASSDLKVIFSHAKDILSNSYGIFRSSCQKMAPILLHDLPEYVPKFLYYESPLDMFKSYKIYFNLIATNGIPDKSITSSHAIDPFWPLCKFEHRGKCNNEHCPWQHARDYDLTPSQFLEQLKKYGNTDMDGVIEDLKQLNSHGNQDPQIYFEGETKEAIMRGLKVNFAGTDKQKVVSQGSMCHIISGYGLKVPIYRIGSHLVKADALTVGALIARSSWRFWKLGFCQSFCIPFAIQRLLLPDMPYLRGGAVREWMLGNNSRLPTCLYSSSVNPDDTKKHLFRGLEDVECWLELAIDAMNFDSNVDKSDGRKKALCVLSRAIEANPNSVAVWVAYLNMFYRKEKVIGKDDMFYHAVQHNKGSYELWLFFINSRCQRDQRIEAYKNAITVLCQQSCADERQDKSSSPYILDLVLQMLNFLSLLDYKHEGITWIDELLSCSNESFSKGQSDLLRISTVLACLTKKDACVLWVSSIHLKLYGKLPDAIVERLEFEQSFPFDVEWQHCNLLEGSYAHAIKMMNNAVCSLSERCNHSSSQSQENENYSLQSVHALVVNHVKCVSAIEGLESARKLCCQYLKFYPFCIELVLISSSIESHCRDDRAGVVLFEESLSNWPKGKPGIQRFWNQFVGYALESKGVAFGKVLIDKWFDQYKMVESSISLWRAGYHNSSFSGHAVEESKDKRKQNQDFSAKTDFDRDILPQDMMFSLLNLAIYRLLNNNPKEAQSAVDQALKAVSDDGDIKHCIRECAALTFFASPDGLEPMKNGFDTRLLQLLDKCFIGSQIFPVPKPLSRAFTERIKKPKVRIFIENLLGHIPVDCSFLNSILEIWYGPSLLPEKFGAFKDLVDFVEGLLELTPVNLRLVLSVSRLIVQRFNPQSISSTAALFWASSLLINSIFQSFPVPPENAWLEIGKFLELLDVGVILEEFYQQALSVHPFSVALWHSFFNFRRRTENLTGVAEAAKERGIIID